jgi:hypothetical protein
MKNKKLKKTTLINLIMGYIAMIAFAALVLANRPAEEVIVSAEPPVEVQEDLFTETKEKEIFVHGDTLIDESVGIDRLNRTIINNGGKALVIDNQPLRYASSPEDTGLVVGSRGNGVIVNDEHRSIAYRDETIIADQGLIYENHHTNDLLLGANNSHGRALHSNGRRDRIAIERDSNNIEDHGILDRRLFELDNHTNKATALTSDGESSPEGNLAGLELAQDGDSSSELDIDELRAENSNQNSYGEKGGELYAYNFPSQGVGAGIGSGAVGAGAGSSAGIGGGIGEAVLEGKTVPTLGGVGTYRSVPVVPPGTGSDGDGDGLEVEAELSLGTDPTKSDSDGDGYSDGEEITSYTNPNDPKSNPGSPGSMASPTMGGVGGLVGGAGAGGAAGLITGTVKPQLGAPGVPAPGCTECEGECKGHGHGHGKHEYELPPNGALHIMMHVDGSGSILDTRNQLDIMKNTLLKEALLPYYNNSEELYNKRVTIVDGNGERTLQFFAEATKKDNVLAIVFQDEASPSYHLPTFNKNPQDHYTKDLQNLKGGLNGYGGLYRGIMFQVDRGRTFAKSFKEFVESAWQGTGYLEGSNLKKYYWEDNSHRIKNKDGVVFSDEYHAKDSGGPEYYLKLIFDASKKVGIDLRDKGAGLIDGKYNKRTSQQITD